MSSSIKVVIDTNVLVSALWSDSGNPSAIIKLMPKSIIPCYNDMILQEYTEVLDRPKFEFSAHKKDALFSSIKEYGEVVTADESNIPMPDESDRVFYDTARASGAILITGNLKHYPPELFIMTPADFLSKMEND